MDTSAEQAWARSNDTMDSMAHMNADLDDLGNLFEFGDIDLNNISSVDGINYDQHMQQNGTHPNTPFDETNETQAMAGTSAQDFGAQEHFGVSRNVDLGQQRQQQQQQQQQQYSAPYTSEPMYQPSMQQHHFHPNQQQFQFQGMQGYPSNQHVPPTPNSFEMHGEAGRFMQQQMDPQQRAILEQRYQLSKEDASAFTPMVSPAGTPQYNVQPEFTIPGAYFSPLTSPMLHAQSQQRVSQYHQGFYTNPSTAPSSNATSPMDPNVDVDMLGDEISLSEPAQSRKSSRKKTATPRSAGPLARVKQSPIQKAAKRKSTTMLSSLVSPREVDGVLETQRSGSVQPASGRLQVRRTDSENGSISPEPLSEALMGPPPRPGSSLTQSPALAAQQHSKSAAATGPAATPKSLLSRRGGQQSTPNATPSQKASNEQDEDMEFAELELPAAAADEPGRRVNLAQLNTQMSTVSSAESDSVRLPARKTPKLGAAGTPLSALPASPSVMGSPMTASTPGALLKGGKADGKGGRGGRKRSSVSVSGTGSALVSPSLRPRISPSIKPLLPEGGKSTHLCRSYYVLTTDTAALHSPTHALLLASKSNYQNLLEGNHLPGVNYPDSLSTGLTSKRTSHKVAEQGRRNRINEALKEMQSLLPKPAAVKGAKETSNSDGTPEDVPEVEGKESKEAKEDAQLKSNSSKAATVESANEYIRKLQIENAALLQLKTEHEEMKRKLEEQTSSAPSTERSTSAT